MAASRLELSGESCTLLRKARLRARQGNVLLIRSPAMPWPGEDCLERKQSSFDLALHLCQGLGRERYYGLACRSDELPFAESSFRLVVLWHILETGEEAELAEACRVLSPGGDLLVLGLQQRGVLARLGQPREPGLPELDLQSLRRNLRTWGLEIDSVRATGWPLQRRWVIRQSGLAGMFLPFAKLLLVQARQENPAASSPLRLAGFRPGVARPTEAASLFLNKNLKNTDR